MFSIIAHFFYFVKYFAKARGVAFYSGWCYTIITGEGIAVPYGENKNMLFKKQLSVDDKIKKATRKKKAQLTGMYMIGVLSGVSWTYTAIAGAVMFREYTMPAVYHFEGVHMETPKVEAIEWNTAIFTAYSDGDGYTPGRTMASGREVYVGAVACPRDIALGSVVEVRGLGLYTCEDRKAIDHDGEFDIYSESVSDALSFGRKTLEYRIIEGS